MKTTTNRKRIAKQNSRRTRKSSAEQKNILESKKILKKHSRTAWKRALRKIKNICKEQNKILV